MAKCKVTFSLESDVAETLKMMKTLTSQDQSTIVESALGDYFAKLGAASGKTSEEFVSFMKEAQNISNALRPDPIPYSQMPTGEEEPSCSALPGDRLPQGRKLMEITVVEEGETVE